MIKKIFDIHFNENEIYQQLYMNDNELISLANKGCLGSHTHTHYPIGLLEDSEIAFELKNSKQYLEELTNSKILTVSYPYGTEEACSEKAICMAKKVGYKVGFTTKKGINYSNENVLLLNRFDCNDLIGGKNYK